MSRIDPHSYFDTDQPRANHLRLNWTVDFQQKQIVGTATLVFETPASGRVDLDTKGLTISSIRSAGGDVPYRLGEEDAIISDTLNHASIIDGVRLSKARRFRYANNDMAALEEELKKAEGSRFKMIATDGVFSMDGIIANLQGVCDLAEKYDAMVMVDDSHAVGFVGKHGRSVAGVVGDAQPAASTGVEVIK